MSSVYNQALFMLNLSGPRPKVDSNPTSLPFIPYTRGVDEWVSLVLFVQCSRAKWVAAHSGGSRDLIFGRKAVWVHEKSGWGVGSVG